MNEINKKICCIFNYAPHYRLSIYKLLESELNCHFYFGNKNFAKMKKLNYEKLNSFKGELLFLRIFSNIYWLRNSPQLFWKSYDIYILTGEPLCLSNWLILIYGKLHNSKRVFLWSHGWYGRENFFKRMIKKIFFSLSDGVLLYGNYAKELMVKVGFEREKLHVVYNSINYSKSFSIRKDLKQSDIYIKKFKNDCPTLLFIGRIESNKRLDMLIKSKLKYDMVYERKFNLIIVGDGVEKEELEKLASRNSGIWFFGECYQEEKIAALIYNADLSISPGNVGLNAIHSLSYGTPVITHDNFPFQGPEFEAIIRNQTGQFFNYGDVDSLTKCIRNWLEKYPSKSQEVVRKCYSVIDERYNPSYQIKTIKCAIK